MSGVSRFPAAIVRILLGVGTGGNLAIFDAKIKPILSVSVQDRKQLPILHVAMIDFSRTIP